MKTETLYLSDIIIPDFFKKTIPNPMNFCKKLSYYKYNKTFATSIIVNGRNILMDGYITYLIAKMLDIKTMNVVVMDFDTIEKLSEQKMDLLEMVEKIKNFAERH